MRSRSFTKEGTKKRVFETRTTIPSRAALDITVASQDAYVAPEARGQHVGRLLMETAIARARSVPGLEQLHLTVVTTQTPARALYRSLGFVSHGSMPHALKLPDGRYLDEDLMVLWLHDEPASE